MKIKRERSTIRKKCSEEGHSQGPITENRGFLFDGRKDKTIIQEKKELNSPKILLMDEHVSL